MLTHPYQDATDHKGTRLSPCGEESSQAVSDGAQRVSAASRDKSEDRSASWMERDEAGQRWAALFAHEMNQPLAAILTTAQACVRLLEPGNSDREETLEAMRGLARRAAHASEVVRRLRGLSRGDPLQRSPADVNEIARGALGLLEGMIHESQVTVSLDLASDLPPASVDAVQINQVVVNLARNAFEAMQAIPPGQRQVTLRTSRVERNAGEAAGDLPMEAAGDRIVVAVEDQGPGLSVDLVDQLFTPFSSTKPQGMGLGLAISRRIIEAHGGRIWVRANTPSGCRFLFTLPLEEKS